jgi:hypothetical protein
MAFKAQTLSGSIHAQLGARRERRRALAQAMIDGKAVADAEAKGAEEKTARLKVLRLAKEAADQAAAAGPIGSHKRRPRQAPRSEQQRRAK